MNVKQTNVINIYEINKHEVVSSPVVNLDKFRHDVANQ